ncbi:cytochrome c biogenesis protein CcmG, thiol:disulfide interchange protein DsbE [Frankia sp. Hr75.2]|nr:cytochrome c biogenesis protein CcmG, thiol:disulfide interchange protein DsbE [Frankia sp. Hr75.2]
MAHILGDELTMRRWAWRLVPPAVALVAGLGASGCSIGADAADGSAEGRWAVRSADDQDLTPPGERKPSPVMTGQTLTGENLELSSLRGRIVVVNFWASWCPPCRAETPALVMLAGRYPQVAFVGVNEKEPATVAQGFVRHNEVAYPNIIDRDGTLVARWPGVPGLPTTFVLDARGRIATRVVGGVTAESLGGLLDRLAVER